MSELWQQAAEWLRDLGVLSRGHAVFKRTARVYDLALALQDGTLLCQLANRIMPNVIDTIHNDPGKQFLKMQNIQGFLESASKFGVKDGDMFAADELYYASDFPKVLSCLSVLSGTKACRNAGITKFPAGAASATARDTDGEDMYQSLEDLVGQSISFQEAAQSSAAYDPDAGEEEDEVYGSIMNVISGGGGGGGAAFQEDDVYAAMVSSKPVEEESIYARTTGASGGADGRSHVLNELQDTEKNFVGVLTTIIEKFMVPMQSKACKAIPKSDCKQIFSNITDILEVHQAFYGQIMAQMASTTGRKLSVPFLTSIPQMKIYSTWCCGVARTMEILKGYEKNKSASTFLEKCKAESGQRFSLKDLMNVPLQRVLKYPLLLKELIKSTVETHKDRPNLMNAKAAVDNLAVHINNTKKDHDTLMDMIASLQSYPSSNPPVQQFAPYVKDGDLMYKNTKGKKEEGKLNLRYGFLLQKAIVLTVQAKLKFKFKALVELQPEMEVHEVPFWTLPKDEQNGKYSFAWSLNAGGEALYVFAAKTLPAKKKWMQKMGDLLEDLRNDGMVAPDVGDRTKGAVDVMAAPSGGGGGAAAKSARKPAPKPSAKGSYEQWVPPAKGQKGGPRPPSESEGLPDETSATFDEETWYAGRLPRLKAEKMFANTPDGTFLIRESDSRPGDYSLSVKFNIVKHIKINRHGKMFELAPDAKAFQSIQELVDHFKTHSLNRHFPGMETTLATPYKDALSKSRGNMGGGGPSAVGIGRARSRFAYTARSPDELTFDRGMELIILSMDDPTLDPGWWKGRLPNGQTGIFPANYVAQL